MKGSAINESYAARHSELNRIFGDAGLWLRHVPIEEIEGRVAAYEQKHGIPSDNVHAAIDDGVIEETYEVCRWLIAYDLLTRVKEARKVQPHD